jgi:hypothetical protein
VKDWESQPWTVTETDSTDAHIFVAELKLSSQGAFNSYKLLQDTLSFSFDVTALSAALRVVEQDDTVTLVR